ncbi:MAG: general secretion pathway protein GspC [Deltaproteobacteria bacterium]|nr:MAG: general secretion pathway protein GspC [Deltaproteobacteria bacterium]
MGFDAQLKRTFPLVICVMIAVAAYLQASGIGQLIAAAVTDRSSAPTTGPVQFSDPLQSNRYNSGKPILARKPFDSITGPLDGTSITVPGAPPITSGAPGAELSDEDPSCSFGRVLLISASDDPAWSFAAIEASGESKLRRQGDDVSGHTVQAMSWDRVWLTSGATRCQMKLGDKSAAKSKPKTAGKKPKRKSRRRGRRLSPEMAGKIHKVSETEYNIERSLVDEILTNQAELMRSARIVPEKKGDDVVGIRLFGIRDGALLSHLGMKNGDRLDSINGFSMSDPQKALEAYGRLRTADKLTVKIDRKGTPTTLDFNIQ